MPFSAISRVSRIPIATLTFSEKMKLKSIASNQMLLFKFLRGSARAHAHTHA
jgi:hypothetical protein